MARPTKNGLDYFPMDCDFDGKLKLFLAEQGHEGLGILVSLWQIIYSEGYWIDNGRKLYLVVRLRGLSEIDKIESVVNSAIEFDIFDKTLHKKHGILTSKAIQSRYFLACKRKKFVNVNKNYLCSGVIVSENAVYVGAHATNVNVNVNVKEKVQVKCGFSELSDKKRAELRTMAIMYRDIVRKANKGWPGAEYWKKHEESWMEQLFLLFVKDRFKKDDFIRVASYLSKEVDEWLGTGMKKYIWVRDCVRTIAKLRKKNEDGMKFFHQILTRIETSKKYGPKIVLSFEQKYKDERRMNWQDVQEGNSTQEEFDSLDTKLRTKYNQWVRSEKGKQ